MPSAPDYPSIRLECGKPEQLFLQLTGELRSLCCSQSNHAGQPLTERDGFLRAPDIVDDTANLIVLMICARYFNVHRPATKRGFFFVANSGEEGLGNLKGCRRIVDDYGSRIREFITLDESRMDRMITAAVGSHRYKATVRTSGGHSFTDFGRVNRFNQRSHT